MQIYINGKSTKVADNIAFMTLLDELNLDATTIIVELNKEVIQKESYSTVVLAEGDRLELVRFVGGG